MKYFVKSTALVSALALSACMGGEGGGDDVVVSSGLLLLELPTVAERENFPEDLKNLINNVEAVNNANQPFTPTGEISYTGTFGIEIENDTDSSLISGVAEVDVAVDGTTVDYLFTADDILDSTYTNVSGTFDGSTTQSAGFYDGSLSGTLTVGAISEPDLDLAVIGTLEGAFATTGETIGVLDGDITPEGSSESAVFTGLYLAYD
jgi:hypothetical protein